MLHTRLATAFTFLIALLTTSNVWAQFDFTPHEEHKKGYLYFENLSADFGTFNESDGIQERIFTAFNIYKYPVIISKVVVGCGCTSATASKDTIAPGDSMSLHVTYDPKGKPGAFNKAVMVYNDGLPYLINLHIKGNVTPRVRTIADDYSVDMGNLKMSKTYHDFGFMYRDEVDTFHLGIYNSGSITIKILGLSGRPAHIMTLTPTMEILPGQVTQLTLIYDARLANDYGDMIHFLTLKTDDPLINEVPLNINAHLLERFPTQTKKRIKKNPKVRFEQEEIDFGKILKGDTVKAVYILHNDGKSPLTIRKIQPACGCTGVVAETMEIAPGKSVRLEIAFDTQGREGEDMKSITVVTNDPARPVAKLFLKGIIVENPNAL